MTRDNDSEEDEGPLKCGQRFTATYGLSGKDEDNNVALAFRHYVTGIIEDASRHEFRDGEHGVSVTYQIGVGAKDEKRPGPSGQPEYSVITGFDGKLFWLWPRDVDWLRERTEFALHNMPGMAEKKTVDAFRTFLGELETAALAARAISAGKISIEQAAAGLNGMSARSGRA